MGPLFALIGVVAGLGIGLVVGAVILRAAVSMYNKLAGAANSSAGAVPEPTFLGAMGIVFVTTLVNVVVGFVVGLAVGGAAVASGNHGPATNITAQLVSFPISLLVMSGMLTAMLPTSFGRAFLVSLCQLAIAFVIVLGVVLVVGAIWMVAGRH